jgi:hypothetical protein
MQTELLTALLKTILGFLDAVKSAIPAVLVLLRERAESRARNAEAKSLIDEARANAEKEAAKIDSRDAGLDRRQRLNRAIERIRQRNAPK